MVQAVFVLAFLRGVVAIKFTVLITQDCNLACTYCYISKSPSVMSMGTAAKVVDFIFERAQATEKNYIAFFGGEPLLAFDRMKDVVDMIERHPRFHEVSVELSVVTNGTVFSEEIADFLVEHDVTYCLSCDGIPDVQNATRRFRGGGNTADVVEETIKKALVQLPLVLVNAVYSPETLARLPDTLRYFLDLGLRQIYLNADYGAPWRLEDVTTLASMLDRAAELYMDAYRKGAPIFISMIDEKVAVILRGGYAPSEKCHMGKKEFAFSPEGYVFPCERILEDGRPDNRHCLGHVDTGVDVGRLACGGQGDDEVNRECVTCALRKYCMNWCGCSNFHATGTYNKTGAFLCAEEKVTIGTALRVLETLECETPGIFAHHLSGFPVLSTLR